MPRVGGRPEALTRALQETTADPWLVLDVRIGRGAWDPAAALAEARSGPRFDGMRGYVAVRRESPAETIAAATDGGASRWTSV